jgi:subtilisin family serine protease
MKAPIVMLWVSLLALALLSPAGAADTPGPGKTDTPFYRVFHVECTSEKSCADLRKLLHREHARGAHVFCHFKQFLDVYLARNDQGVAALKAITGFEGYFAHEGTSDVTVPPPPKTRPGPRLRGSINADAIVRGPVLGLSGKGVIVAILDTGIDFHNEDFIKVENGKRVSRLLYYWDTLAKPPQKIDLGNAEKPPVLYPNGVGVGALYTRDELSQAVADNDRSVQIDEDGHGTACATIAAGNGQASKGKYRGVAPDADLVAVRLGKLGRMETGYLLNAICGWLDQLGRRLDRRVVVSCSFGGNQGGCDGQNVEYRQLNARFAAAVGGRALCVSAGNDGYQPIHVELKLGPGGKAELQWSTAGPQACAVKLLFDASSPNEVQFEGKYADQARGNLVLHRPSGQLRSFFAVEAGKGSLTVKTTSPRKMVVDAYVFGAGSDGLPNSTILSPRPVYRKLIKNLAATPNAITVGSYDWNPFGPDSKLAMVGAQRGRMQEMRVGALSSYSSPGPSRAPGAADAVKPDLVAPGQWFVYKAPASLKQGSGQFSLMNGTSASTPYVAGVVALMLEARPELSVAEIKGWLHRHARDDEFTSEHGKLPNSHWGHGKLNAAAVMDILKDLKAGKKPASR